MLVVRQQIGDNNDFQHFSEAIITTLDDIAGFETITKKRLNRLIAILWRKYHGQSTRKETQKIRSKAGRKTHRKASSGNKR